MKQSSAEQQKKKLKQARLPFQILSPGVKNPVADSPPQRKRKATESESDNDVTRCEAGDIKENHVSPLEKKAKVVSSDGVDKDTSDLKTESIKQENGNKDTVLVEADKSPKTEKPVASKTPVAKKRGRKSTTPSNSAKKNKTDSSHKGKGSGKKGDVTGPKESGKKNKGTSITKNDVVDIIDLSDSPCKTNDEEKSVQPTVPKYKDEIQKGEMRKQNQAIKEGSKEDDQNTESNKKLEGNTEKESNKNSEELHLENGIVKKNIVEAKAAEKNNVKNCKAKAEKSNDKQSTERVDDSATEKVTKDDSKKSKQNNTNDQSKKPDDQTANTDDEAVQINEIASSSEKCDSEESKQDDLNSSLPRVSSQSSLDNSLSTPSSTNESLTNSNTPSVPNTPTSTPGTSAKKSFKSPLTTPRRMTPKQLMKFKEKEEKNKEKERLKQEKEKKKAEEREEKMRQKLEKEEEKQKLKQEKEEEKKKEREEKEKKRQAEIEQKNEEKRLKEEEKQLKAEEKRAKEEERRKKEEEEKKKKEEKRLKEEQKEAEKRKSAQAFASFFVKSETKVVDESKESAPVESSFQPFEVKNDMRLAPLVRVQLSEERKQMLETVVNCTANGAGHRLYLEEVKSPSYTRGSATTTWPAPDDTEDDVIIVESEQPNEEIEVKSAETGKKSEKRRHRAKLLQFHENRRPPYWGTWRKKSKYIRPRTPLNQDKTMFEYDIDSDDEWEEPEDGESLRGSEDEESQDEQYEEDNDMFVPHGYLSDEEGQDELDDKSPEAMKARLKFLQMEFEAERSEKQEKLKPRLIGCVWFCNSVSEPSSVGSHIAELFLSRRAVWEGSLPISVAAPLPSSPSTPSGTNNENEDSRGAKRKLVHESMIPHIIRKVHGSRKKLTKLMKELLEEQHEPCPQPSKRCLADKIREIALWTHSSETGHHCWYVKEEVRQTHGLMDLIIKSSPPPPTPPSTPTTNITKFTKVLTSDERLKLLRESPSSTKDSTKTPNSKLSSPNLIPISPSVKPTTPSVKLTTPSKPGPSVKKRAALVSVPRGQPLPKQSPSTLMSFVHTVTKPGKSEENAETSKSISNVDKATKTGEKEKKRITPITLSSVVSKPQPQLSPSKEEIIVLDD